MWYTRSFDFWIEMYRKRIKEVFTKKCNKFKKWEHEDPGFGERSSQNEKKKL